ncbi:MAG: NUDIX hydrolase, partial [Gammaproteobacteria bacterium]
QPSLATPLTCWQDAGAHASVVPGGALPPALNGVAFAALAALPAGLPVQVAEPEYHLPAGLAAAAGVVVLEDDGRVWLVSPTNGFGGYAATFPKGRVDAGTSLAATAVREAFEESGLLVRIEAHLIDVRRTLTYTRYYLARRIGGSPAAMGWESQAVHLVPRALLPTVAAHRNDAAVIAALEARSGR